MPSTLADACELGAELYEPERLTVVGVGPDESALPALFGPLGAAGAPL